jgi:CPA1 family monovalent cation:H+ antiporter
MIHALGWSCFAAERAEVLKLHRSGMIHDEVLRTLESDLDLQERPSG